MPRVSVARILVLRIRKRQKHKMPESLNTDLWFSYTGSLHGSAALLNHGGGCIRGRRSVSSLAGDKQDSNSWDAGWQWFARIASPSGGQRRRRRSRENDRNVKIQECNEGGEGDACLTLVLASGAKYNLGQFKWTITTTPTPPPHRPSSPPPLLSFRWWEKWRALCLAPVHRWLGEGVFYFVF